MPYNKGARLYAAMSKRERQWFTKCAEDAEMEVREASEFLGVTGYNPWGDPPDDFEET